MSLSCTFIWKDRNLFGFFSFCFYLIKNKLSTVCVFLYQGDSGVAYVGYKGRNKRKAVRDERRRWTNKTVPYKIERGLPHRTVQWIFQAMKHWEKYTCLRFLPRQRQLTYIVFVRLPFCSSPIGMIPKPGAQEIMVGSCSDAASLIHEIGHAIGFFHEHSRPDRDLYVDIPISDLSDQSVQKYGPRIINTFNLDYDYRSIMHYGDDHFNIRTLDKYYQDKIGKAKWLSFLDIQLANLMYKCDEGCQSRPWCPEEGYIGEDCQCNCEGEVNGKERTQRCDILRWQQVKYIALRLIWARIMSHHK